MNDPDSYEHVKTTWSKWNDERLVAYVEVRGRNSFNAKILATYVVILTFDNEIVSCKQVE